MTDYSENNKNSDERCDGCEKQGVLKDYAVVLAAAIIILGGLHASRSILGPIFLAAFFSAMLVSPLRWLRSKGFSQAFSLCAVIIFVLAVGLGTMTVVGAQLAQFAKDIPTYRDLFNEELKSYNLNVGDFVPFLKEEETPDESNGANDENADELALERRVRDEVDRAVKNVRMREATEKARVPAAEPNLYDETTKFLKETANSTDVAVNVDAKITPVAYWTQDDDGANEQAGLTPTMEENSGVLTAVDDPEGLTPQAPKSGLIETTLDEAEEEAEIAETDVATEELEPLSAAEENEEEREPLASAPQVSVVDAGSNELFRFLAGLASELSYFASNGFIITLLIIFMLCETTSTPKKLAAALGKQGFVNEHIQKVVADIRNYMVIKTWMSLGVGTSVTLLLVVSDVQYPLLWGFVAFLLNYIPNIGSVVAAIPPIVLATVEHGLVVGAVDAVFFVIINCTIGYAIEPRLLGNGLDLSPLIVLIALILFGWLLGPIGMFLSPPLAVIMKIIFQSFPETRWIAVLMANRPPKESVGDEESAEASA
ncbi:MAG: AI-2E family transporter [Thermoguttaceae bacterium]|nr:AI-2E family transporter [Thermoguttaceae bacterium]MBQ9800327.1 AI-2E family transporter [Thermoguttaceae bacterium]